MKLMSKKNNFVAAIDIGTTKIVAIIGKKNENGKLEILGMGKSPSKGVKRGVVFNIEETVNAIQTAVMQAEEMAGVKAGKVFVGIAGQHIKSVRNRGYINRDSYDAEITRDDVDALIADMYKIPIDAGEEIIHVLPQSYIVDNEVGVKNPIGMFGKRLEANFHIVIGQIASANNIKKCINRVGLEVNNLVLEPLASSSAVLSEDEKEVGVALVDIGGGTTDIAVYYDGIIRHTAVIPFGGNVVTYDIKEGCSILERQAEALKVQFGSSLAEMAKEEEVVTVPGINGRDPKEISFKNLAYIIQSRMEEIIGAIYFEIESSGFLDKLGAGIVLTGGGALLRHLPQLVAFKTGLDVRIGYPTEHLITDSLKEVNQTMYSTSIGLIIKGYEEVESGADWHEEFTEPEVEEKEEVIEKSVDKKEPRLKPFDGLLKKFGDFFEEKDAKL
ncbi:MAG: cell division protein FtsA [Marinilabiliales bacterium]|nr:MAG: cell division protein FtsA [Marinilabiliales bacterium]